MGVFTTGKDIPELHANLLEALNLGYEELGYEVTSENIKVKDKILFNMAMAKSRKDPKLFKPLQDGIWYFRAQYFGVHYRIFAFWDKTNKIETLVIATHGIVKKSDKPVKSEILKAKAIREKYFESKQQ